MKYQRGVSLSGLLFWGAIFAMVAMLAIKVAPSAIEYYKVIKDAKATVANLPSGATVPEVRAAFRRYAEVDHLVDFKPEDLDIGKEGGQVVISVDYRKEIPLFANVSLVINYKGSTGAAGKD